MALAAAAVLLLLIPGLLLTAMAATPYPHGARGDPLLGASKRYEGSSDLVDLRYHMGPVLSAAPLRLYVLWYGRWDPAHQAPTLANVTRRVALAGEAADASASLGRALSRLDIQRVLAAAVAAGRLPADARGGAYLVLTAPGVGVQDFCRAVCGFHYFTFPSLVGHTLPYAWVGHSGGRCADVCAYPFALPSYMSRSGMAALRPPNGDAGVDGIVSVIAHELAELATNPLINAWYAGEDPNAPTEIADLCEGVYGTGGGGGYAGKVAVDAQGRSWNVNGRNGRKFLVQWLWSPEAKACVGPNASD
ncbi:uncharacterized protein C2845_PM02G21220 [Panicum miliaceum]|uniref:Protein EXORDIUM-like 5 n=1 Tax=Panicum miliaceum TaxID=4540 RepID=A0A3L6S4A2_PANMI|nr:uncharacterized protein C2845_PM02G21220 [Panicum miliaceum]